MGKEEGGDFRDCRRILMETQEFSDLRLTSLLFVTSLRPLSDPFLKIGGCPR
jgi:hypothetical protein